MYSSQPGWQRNFRGYEWERKGAKRILLLYSMLSFCIPTHSHLHNCACGIPTGLNSLYSSLPECDYYCCWNTTDTHLTSIFNILFKSIFYYLSQFSFLWSLLRHAIFTYTARCVGAGIFATIFSSHVLYFMNACECKIIGFRECRRCHSFYSVRSTTYCGVGSTILHQRHDTWMYLKFWWLDLPASSIRILQFSLGVMRRNIERIVDIYLASDIRRNTAHQSCIWKTRKNVRAECSSSSSLPHLYTMPSTMVSAVDANEF